MDNLVIFAVEDNVVFDKAYADNMKLPFSEGWERWAVFRREGETYTRLYEADSLAECEDYLQAR